MDNSILISRYVQQILEESEEVRAILGNDQHKIFPLLQPDTIEFPFIVHSRNSIAVTYTKDIEYMRGRWTNEINYIVSCVSDNYIQCLELANAVRHAMETYRWKDEDIYIHPIKVNYITEYTTEQNAFVQEIQFNITVE